MALAFVVLLDILALPQAVPLLVLPEVEVLVVLAFSVLVFVEDIVAALRVVLLVAQVVPLVVALVVLAF